MPRRRLAVLERGLIAHLAEGWRIRARPGHEGNSLVAQGALEGGREKHPTDGSELGRTDRGARVYLQGFVECKMYKSDSFLPYGIVVGQCGTLMSLA